jgi:hypothetical protein
MREIAMSDTWIKNRDGALLARIKIESSGYQLIYEVNGHYLGMYNPISNTTHYRDGALFCRGNALTALIESLP